MSTHIFKLPDLGEGTVSAEIVAWHVKPGDVVAEDQPLVEMSTDKAVVEIPAPVSGRVLTINGKPGDVIAVGSELATFDTEAIAMAIVGSSLPVFTGLGHEIDRSVADEVAHAVAASHATDGNFYGTTAGGGRPNAQNMGGGQGGVFEMSPAGTLCLDIFSPRPGNSDVAASQVEPLPPATGAALALSQNFNGVRAAGTAPSGEALHMEAWWFARGRQVFQAVVYTQGVPPQALPAMREPFFEGLKLQ